MYLRFAKRLLFEADKRLLWKASWNFGWKGMWSVVKHKRRLKRGEFFPPFLYISIINSCNLRCQGCWVDVAAKQSKIELPAMNKMINEAKAMGNSFFGILGGEPFMHPELLDIFDAHPDAYFQVFTNGQFIAPDVAKRMHKAGNVTPLISIEGSEIISDVRRGRPEVYSKSMEGIQNCLDAKLMTGVCTSVCQSNYEMVSEKWLDRLIEMGVMYAWFHVYRPMGPDANPELSLTPEQQWNLRKFVVDMRVKKPIVIVDAYNDDAGRALCPAVTGFTHHVSPWGDIEPCPIIQFAKESIYDERPLKQVFNESAFLKDFRETTAKHTRGCVVLERPDLLLELAERHGAKDTTARKKVFEEIKNTVPRTSQYFPGKEIPERSWAYWLAKHFFFNDYGAYGRQEFKVENWVDPRERNVMQGRETALPLVQLSAPGK